MSAHDRVHVNAPACSGPDSEGTDAVRPDISVIVPVNARGDLQNVHYTLGDIGRYGGPHSIETILVVNNFPAADTPPEVAQLRRLGATVLAIPDVRRPGEAVGFSARIPGRRAASADYAVLFGAYRADPHDPRQQLRGQAPDAAGLV